MKEMLETSGIEPDKFLDFLNFERSVRPVLTDSGGVQEEAAFWGCRV